MRFKAFLLVFSVSVSLAQSAAATTIASWTVRDGTAFTGINVPIRDGVSDPLAANIGLGSMVATQSIGGQSFPFLQAGFGVNASVNSSLTTPDDGTGAFSVFSSRFAAATLDMTVSTQGYSGISFSADFVRTSFSAGVSFNFSYSVDGGSVFQSFGGGSPGNTWQRARVDVTASALNVGSPTPDNRSDLIFRIILTGGSLTGNSGSGALDNILISAATAPPQVPVPAGAMLLITAVGALGLSRFRQRTTMRTSA